MSLYELEVGREPRTSLCPDCGGVTLSTAGFIYRDGKAHAVYYASTYPSHATVRAHLAIGIGTWIEPNDTAEVSFFVAAIVAGDAVDLSFVDPDQTPWTNASALGHQLAAAAADRDPSGSDFRALAELVTQRDGVVSDAVKNAGWAGDLGRPQQPSQP